MDCGPVRFVLVAYHPDTDYGLGLNTWLKRDSQLVHHPCRGLLTAGNIGR